MKAVKQNIKQLIGTIYTIGAPQVAEIIAMTGFDWVLIDMEHSTLSLESVQNALQAMKNEIIKIVRIPVNDDTWIKRVLDTGCDGILVPMIRNADDADRAVISSRYPVEGQRSVGLSRAHKYGLGFSDYVKKANSELIIMIQVEHIEAVRNIDTILEVKGIDAIFIGPYDLSASMGYIGQPDHHEVLSVIELVKNKCRATGIPYGIFGVSSDALTGNSHSDCKYLLCGVDAAILSDSYTDLLKRLRNK
jgi:2-keto-3-deoxy-L-rhamnonate aldolase RhmA